ncbi:MAG: hypothetical protein AAF582_00175 [Pseudomonadota bacterium]
MTTASYPGPSAYVVNGVGPYAIGFEYDAGAIEVVVPQGSDQVVLDPSNYTLVPEAGNSGTLTLTAAAATLYDGLTISIGRNTTIVQTFVGQNAVQRTIAVALDTFARIAQEIKQASVAVDVNVSAFMEPFLQSSSVAAARQFLGLNNINDIPIGQDVPRAGTFTELRSLNSFSRNFRAESDVPSITFYEEDVVDPDQRLSRWVVSNGSVRLQRLDEDEQVTSTPLIVEPVGGQITSPQSVITPELGDPRYIQSRYPGAVNLPGETGVQWIDLPAQIAEFEFVINQVSLDQATNFLIQLGTAANWAGSNYVGRVTNLFGFLNPTDGFSPAVSDAARNMCGIFTFKRAGGNTFISTHTGNTEGVSTTLIGSGRIGLADELTRVRILAGNGATFDQGAVRFTYKLETA